MAALPDGFWDGPEWLAFEHDPAGDRVTLLRLTEADYRSASFLDQRVLRPGAELRQADWGALAPPDGARRDADYIFHIGNVGSTLISRLLGELPQVFALREPLLLRGFAAAPPDETRFATLAALLSRTFWPEQRANVKATSFASELAPRLVRPGARALFLFASPDHYLENILAGENSWQTLQALSAARLARLQRRCPRLATDLSLMHDALRAALGWACEMTSLGTAAARLPEGSVMWLDFDTFLAAPADYISRIAAHFGYALAPGESEALCAGPIMHRYSKAPEYDYSPALRREILADARRRHAAPIRDALNWLARLESLYPAVAGAIRRARGES